MPQPKNVISPVRIRTPPIPYRRFARAAGRPARGRRRVRCPARVRLLDSGAHQPFHPLASAPAPVPARDSRSRKIPRISAGAAMNSTITGSITLTTSAGVVGVRRHDHAAGAEGPEQQAGEHRAAGRPATQQRDRDRVEAEPGVDVLGQRGAGAQDLRATDQSGQCAGDQHDDEEAALDLHARRARGERVRTDGAQGEAQGGARQQPPADHGREQREDQARSAGRRTGAAAARWNGPCARSPRCELGFWKPCRPNR